MSDYHFMSDLMNSFRASSDYIKTLMILAPLLFIIVVIYLLLLHRRRTRGGGERSRSAGIGPRPEASVSLAKARKTGKSE